MSCESYPGYGDVCSYVPEDYNPEEFDEFEDCGDGSFEDYQRQVDRDYQRLVEETRKKLNFSFAYEEGVWYWSEDWSGEEGEFEGTEDMWKEERIKEAEKQWFEMQEPE